MKIRKTTTILLLVLLLVFTACAPKQAAGGLRCTLYIECSRILENIGDLDPDKLEVLPDSGVILEKCECAFSEGETVYDVLVRETRSRGIHMESSYTPVYDSAYVEGINNLYEFDCGEGSGWTYCVNGVFPNYGCSGYKLQNGDAVEWHYTCDYGRDVGASDMTQLGG